MDINQFVSREEIKKDQDRQAAGGEMGDSRFWRIPDKKSVIRLLPRLENKVPYKTVLSHRYNANGEKIFGTCMKTFGKKDCPVCKRSWAIHESSEEKDIKDMGYQSRATARFMYNCYIVNDPEKPENNGSIKIFSVGKKLQDLILESVNSDDLGNAVFDPINGFDFEINRKKSGDNPNFPDYSSSRFVFKRGPIEGPNGKISKFDEIKDKLINIDELIKEETPEELKQKFSFLWNGQLPPPSEKKTEKKSTEKKEKTEEEIDIDELEGDNGVVEEPTKTASDEEDLDIEDELDKL
jgi:hypothetical protein